ncbi:MAG: aminopeptidase N [Alphaproteobacteria bacterium]|nr:aminopeptidase N [Alphaproteobacteria bacterium]
MAMSKLIEKRLADYTPPDFLIDQAVVDIDIRDDHARVTARYNMRRNPKSKNKNASLVLNGEKQRLMGVTLDGTVLSHKEYKLTDKDLTIPNIKARAFTLEVASTHNPYENTELYGLYAAGNMLNTQCESEGFRKIIYALDRPDVLTVFTVTLHADRKKYPILLSNGNPVSTGKEKNGRHFAVWHDPFPKPCYLFAVVAGDLDKVTDSFVTRSRRKVAIEMYVAKGKKPETAFAMRAIKQAMKWDEDVFGLEYDLDRFMIVSTPNFNSGAMENKGLNIFNDVCVLGRAETASDNIISFIQRVVGHEYFHNWTGDRVTCRDWFQLSLKEGLTVFREQEFMGDMNSIPVERLGNVRMMRNVQFAEDAGAMSHPVRPDKYQSIRNFYTATVYEKGSEVIRMIQTLVGKKGFRKGMDLYFKRHDGQAVTCDDFVKAMADANKIDLRQFMLWYSQSGTPTVTVRSRYDAKTRKLHLSVKQKTKPTADQKKKQPLHIPLAVGLLDEKGRNMIPTRILELKKPAQEFVFNNVKTRPVLSLLRDFSAPVRLDYPYTDQELLFLLAHDSDAFCRWEASVKLLTKYMLALANGKTVAEKTADALMDGLRAVLRDEKLDADFRAMVLSLPTEGELGLAQVAGGQKIDPDALVDARKAMMLRIAYALRPDIEHVYGQLKTLSSKATDGVSMGKRSLKNLCLAYLAQDEEVATRKLIMATAIQSTNMTDQVAGLGILSSTKTVERDEAFALFEKRWGNAPTIMDSWFAAQARAKRKNVLKDVRRLTKHPAYDGKNPNRISALVGAFANNIVGFHAVDGSGYKFVADMIVHIDAFNPDSAARLAKGFARWRDYELKRQKLMQTELRRIAAHKKLSSSVSEIVNKSLKA